MKKKTKLNVSMVVLLAGLMAAPCFVGGGRAFAKELADAPTIVEIKSENIYKGKITGISKKAKSIAIKVGKGKKAKTLMLRFNAKTKGMEHAKKGESAIITYELQGQEKIATLIKPKLAKLPAGVTEMQPQELVELVAKGPAKGRFMLLDSRPANRFAKGHVSSAVSLPVSKFKKLAAAVLPQDKDYPLIFHCGGPT